MPVSAKICGVSTPDAVSAAVAGGASHIGFVFFAGSPRHVEIGAAAALAARIPDAVGRVGVFVDAEAGYIVRAVNDARLTAVQLHGEETPQRVAALRDQLGIEIWKAVPVRTRADVAAGPAFRGVAHRLLYDAKPPKGAALPGGLGLRFDWRLLDGFAHPLPWALSGGLDAGIVADAVAISGARLVDVSSGVENAPGVKDVDKIAAFLQAVARL